MLALIVGAVMLSGCSAHLYQTSNNNSSSTVVKLSQKNFKVIGEVEGTAKSTVVFGIGGLSKKAVRSNAIAQMFKNAKLYGSQTIININVKQSYVGLPPIYWRTVHTATGTIVEFTE